jgi:cell division protein FtsB
MVSRARLKSFLTGVALYTMAAAAIGYFGVNAYTGKYGLNARQELDQEIVALTSELARLKRQRAARFPAPVGVSRPRYAG